jgi:hypothetical protein
MGEIIRLSQTRIRIVVYTRGGFLPWTSSRGLRQNEQERTLAVIQGVVKELGQWYFDVQMRSWFSRCYELLFRGAWLSPVVMIEGSVFSQGAVPDRARLRPYLNEQIHILRPRLAKSS